VVLVGVISISDAFAGQSEVTIRTVSGSSASGCETSGGCYTPNIATVDQFGRVIFSNTDTAAHTFTSGTGTDGPSGEFDSGLVIAGSSYEWTPFFAGEVTYFCMLHPWMTGTVIVDEFKEPTTYTSQTSSYTGKTTVTGTDTVVSYTITGGKLYNITPSVEAHSLAIAMSASQDGSLVITLPRSLIDAKTGNSDDSFFVVVDGGEANYDEKIMSSSRIITITFPAGTEEIEIVGTFVYDNFNYSPTPTPTPTPYVPTPMIPSSANIVIPSGTVSPGCENTNSCYQPSKFTSGKGSTVTWFNADSAAHTVTSGNPTNGPSGEFDSSLLISGSSFSHKFNSDGTYPYFCMLHPWMTGYVIIQRGGTISPSTPMPSPIPTTSGIISVSTDNFQYSPGDLVTVKVSTSKSANVAVSVISPSGDNIVSRTISTDSGGSGSLQFKLPESSQNGSYRIDSTATISGSKVSDSTTFTVKSTLSRVNIVSLQPTDQQGNAVSSFTKGKLGFVKVVLSSDSNANSLVTINLFDSELTSLGIGSFKTTLGSGQSEMTLSFFIPNDAKIGNGDIYANVFSDWPSQGGVPLTGESSTQVRIQ
jgi:plastocyanin